MGFGKRILEGISQMQVRHERLLIAAIAVFTLLMLIGAFEIRVQTDMAKENPQDLPVYKVANLLTSKFGGQDTVIIAVTLDAKDEDAESIKDIRDPRVISYLAALEDELKSESMVDEATSAGSVFRNFDASTASQVERILGAYPSLSSFFSKDLKTTVVYVKADLGGGEDKVIELENMINEKLSKVSKPPGVDARLTGNPPIRVQIFKMLVSDAVFTFVVSYVIIFLMILLLQRSMANSAIIMFPLTLGTIWTLGTLGWFGIPLSIATVGIGAMLLGLGVEYGAFMLARFVEYRGNGCSAEESLNKAVPAVGLAISGSGGTTVIGFLALTLSVMPMLQHLGMSLALGITYALASTIFAMPITLLLWERRKERREREEDARHLKRHPHAASNASEQKEVLADGARQDAHGAQERGKPKWKQKIQR